ncbi:MAG: hypothetical protein JEY99_13275 [Spirochaetales bacterium]|nr:hypothetical protein [Spirochaetales bacterium]
MIQFFFLSVLLNVVGGALLASDFLNEKLPVISWLNDPFRDMANSRLILGILSIIVGIFKLLSVISGDVKIVGDLLPALSGLLVGFGLLVEYYRTRTDVQTENNINTILDNYKHIFGTAAIGVGILHFFFPRVLFL